MADNGVSVCPAVALDSGVELLCRLFEVWGQVPAGVLVLTEWLLGDEDSADRAVADRASSLLLLRLPKMQLLYIYSHYSRDQDEEDVLFEKGDLNLWAEPVQWVRLLHRHLGPLVLTFKQGTGTMELDQVHHIHTLSSQAQAKAVRSQQALKSLPAVPQFSCPMEHARLVLQLQRATLALDVLDRLRERSFNNEQKFLMLE